MYSFTQQNAGTNKSFLAGVAASNPSANGAIVKLFLFLTCSILQFTGFGQNVKPEEKIDPVFRYMIAESKARSTSTRANSYSPLKVEPTEGIVLKTGQIEKRYECIVYTKNLKALKDSGIIINSALPTFATAWVTLDQITQMAAMPDVSYIDAPETDHLHNDVSVGTSGASLLQQGKLNNTPYKGKNVIVAIYDTGIDWDHLDFRNPDDTTKSRILRIWDQTLTAVTGEAPPAGFSYGVEYTQTQINNEIDGTPANVVREKDTNGHGTHVAGTAAGNGAALPSRKYAGLAPEADIVIIKGSDTTFSESRIIDGMTYLRNLSTALGKPVVMNLSLGGHVGPHDGTRAYEVAVDNFTASAAGRSVVISAGNDNGANLHNRLTLEGSDSNTVQFTVTAGTGGTYVFRYGVYANNNSAITATVTAPDGKTVTANAGQTANTNVISDSFNVYVENRINIPNNQRYVLVYLTRNGTNTTSPAGTYTLTLTNNTANALTLDGWLYERNSNFRGTTTLVGGDNNFLVGSPGNAATAITTGSFVGKNSWYSAATPGAFFSTTARVDSISTFSARGPRRDGVLKPEIASDGQVVVSCLSSNITPAASTVVEIGLYQRNQGTSMAAPGVTGSVALLYQANDNATNSQVKNLLISTATKDAMTELTGATPNPVWGYGKIDIFKAASTLFNCTPANRRLYKYDSSTRNAQESVSTFSTQRIAVRFTPDMSGKLGGVFFHTSQTATALFLEVRTNNAGNPGTLLGTLDLDSSRVARYTFNYVDVTNLNINVTSSTDYFVVLGRAGTSTSNWSLRGDTLAVDGRTMQSTNEGTTWTTLAIDYKIRSVVYNNGQLSGAIATTNSTDTRNINSSYQFINGNCQVIAQVVPTGTDAVTGNVTGKVWIESTVPTYNSNPYVQRHYEITPATATATARVTLYFTQAEFNAFNSAPGSILDLPANPTDSAGKANLRVTTFPGTSSNGTGSPETYTGTPVVIDPADGDIVWNTEANRWEVNFDVTGFGGFIVQTSAITLPITIEYFKGNKQGYTNTLNWKINCTSTSASFDVQRSDNGSSFNSIGSLSANPAGCGQPFNFTDASPLSGANYYRIKIIESTGVKRYTSVILLQTDKAITSAVYPTLIRRGSNIQVNYAGVKGYITINDAAGKQLYKHSLTNGIQTLSLPLYVSGVYFYNIKDDKGTAVKGKIIVE